MFKRSLLLALAVTIVGCSDDGVSPPPADVAPVLTFADQTQAGTSSLVRNAGGISFAIETTGLEPQSALSVWIVVFNQPQNCASSPCDEPDLFRPEVEADVLGSPGLVVGATGAGTLSGDRAVGDASNSLLGALGLPSPGILDTDRAEIHFILRSHGPAIAGREDEMIRTFNGGCQHPGEPFPDPLPSELGAPGPNSCVDVQFAVHER